MTAQVMLTWMRWWTWVMVLLVGGNRQLLVQALNRQSACQEAFYCEAPMPDVEEYRPLAPGAELVHVSLYLRHGDRTPLLTADPAVWGQLVDQDSLLKLDPLYFPDEEPGIQGLLTIRGQQQLWRLGTTFRHLYGPALNLSSRADALDIYSTALSRTYLSAQAFLEGVYPPQGPAVAIQLASLPLPPTPAESPEGSIFETSDRHFCQACYPELGTDPAAEGHCRLARETFAARPVIPDRSEVAHLLQHSLRLLADQEAASPAARASVLVAHDTTIVSLLSQLGATDPESQRWPPYAANLLIEVWRQADALAVRIIYNGRSLPLAWCSQPERCPLLEFISHLA